MTLFEFGSALIATSRPQSMLCLLLHPGHINLSIFTHGGDHAVVTGKIPGHLSYLSYGLAFKFASWYQACAYVLDIDFWILTSPTNWGRFLYLPLLLLPCPRPCASNLCSDPGDSCLFRNWVINQAIYFTQHNITLSIPHIILFIILIVSAISVIFFTYITSNETFLTFLSLVTLVILYYITVFPSILLWLFAPLSSALAYVYFYL